MREVAVFDLPYIVTHPLCARIIRHYKELEDQARTLPDRSKERKALEKRIGKLQEFGLPKPTKREQEETELIGDHTGRKIGERHSIRRRFIAKRRGRPAEWSIKVRAALEEKIANPNLKWRELAEKFGFKSPWRKSQDGTKIRVPGRIDLESQVRRLKRLLRHEKIEVPTAMDYREAENRFRLAMTTLNAQRSLDPFEIG